MIDGIEKIDLNGKDKPKIIIIGAGISGIATADTLIRAGFTDFKILEASGRTGGRIWTVDIDEGQKVDLGAHWIHGIERNPIYKIADDNNLLKLRHGDKGLRHRNCFITEEGKEVNEKVVNSVNLAYGQLIIQAEDFYQSSIPTEEENDSVGAFLEREFSERLEKYTNGDRHIRELVFNQRKLLECCISGCDRLEDVSLSEFGGYEELPGVHYSIPPGFEAVLEILKSSIPKDNILLNHPVRCVHWSRKNCNESDYKVMVECENGEMFYANHVIVTVSLGVLKAAYDRMFDPPLPEEKVGAIDRLGFGIVDKVILKFDKPVTEPDVFRIELLWDDDNIKCNDLRHTWYRKIYSFEVLHESVLVGWLSGKEALYMESLTEDQIAEDLVEVLKKFLQKDHIPSPSKIIRTRWGNNSSTRGSYSFIKVGASMTDIDLLAEPLTDSETEKPQVMFGGEATHECHYSTTHGALLSGMREANRIIKLYSD